MELANELINDIQNLVIAEMKKFIRSVEEIQWEEIRFEDWHSIHFSRKVLQVNFRSGENSPEYFFIHDYKDGKGWLSKKFLWHRGPTQSEIISDWFGDKNERQ